VDQGDDHKLRRTTWIFYSCVILVVGASSAILCGGGQCAVRRTSQPPRSTNSNTNTSAAPKNTPPHQPERTVGERNDTVADVLEPFGGALLAPFLASTTSNNVTSAELWALEWSIYIDPLRHNLSSVQRITQRYALATLFWQPLPWQASVHSPSLSGDDECLWFGVGCDSDNHVTSIHLPAIGLTTENENWRQRHRRRELRGTTISSDRILEPTAAADEILLLGPVIPSAIGLLTRLTILDLSGNMLGGTLPRNLYNLTLMEQFNTSGNYLTGSLPRLQWPNLRSFATSGFGPGTTLPDWIGRWTALEQFELDSSGFVGTIPTTISRWTSIREVVISLSTLSGTLPTNLEPWTMLERLVIFGSNFHPMPIPSDIQFWTNLRILQLDISGLTGTIPESMANLTALEMLSLRSTSENFTGPVPLGNWPKLQHIDLSYNSLTGRLPSKPSWTQLVHYEMVGNQFTGGLSMDVGFWTSLVRLAIQDQVLLGGTIPTEIGQCTLLQELYLQNNAHTGQIPSELSQCTELKTLSLSQNALTGPIPSELSMISTLKGLSITATNITGSIPNASMWTAMEYFDVSNNQLSGTLPISIGLWTNLVSFSVTGNRLNGSLDNLLSASLPLLGSLELSTNMFSGPLHEPTEIQPSSMWFPSLQYFDVSFNRISGSLPSSLARWTVISSFNVNTNKLTGTIPPILAEKWFFFGHGNFKGNLFQGPIPFCNSTDVPDLDIQADCDVPCDCCSC
jgi:Leucine-rich repeat (LRR) protein